MKLPSVQISSAISNAHSETQTHELRKPRC